MTFSITEILPFWCTFCGKEFGDDVIELALHIADKHDERPTRNKR